VRKHPVIIIGAGMAGLSAALELSARGLNVLVLERASHPGGKMRQVDIEGHLIDAGPTVFTMRWVFDELFASAGTSTDAHLKLRKVQTLARHAWSDTGHLDLFADIGRSADAIGRFSSRAEAARYLEFCKRAARVFGTLDHSFIRASQPTPIDLVRRIGIGRVDDLWQISPLTTLWRALGQHFQDPRLRQLFGRYATYCGSSPYLASATLMLIAHVEQQGVWLVDGGMHAVARALAGVATAKGATFRYGAHVQTIRTSAGRVSGVTLATGEQIDSETVIFNGDAAALGAGLLGDAVQRAAPAVSASERSLSAVTFSLLAETQGFPLLRHSVFFSDNYAAEFDDIFKRRQLPTRPTVYVCAQDRGDDEDAKPSGPERLFLIVNAPANGDTHTFDKAEIERCELRTFQHLERLGLKVHRSPARTVATSPSDFDRSFPATGGALYGRASHGWTASFSRPGARSKIPGLYLAGGSVHPGPGVPMAAQSGRIVSQSVLTDLASTPPSRRAATAGGTSMR
jgi:1-hydroxycarotenoid 3,4-desaturase